MENMDVEFCAEYFHGGKRWGLNFFASDEEDAIKKIDSIKSSLLLSGQLIQTVQMNTIPSSA